MALIGKALKQLKGKDHRGNVLTDTLILWLDKIIWKGLWNKLDGNNLPNCCDDMEVFNVTMHFEEAWKEKERKSRKYSLITAFYRANYFEAMVIAVTFTLVALIEYVIALSIEYYLTICENSFGNNSNSSTNTSKAAARIFSLQYEKTAIATVLAIFVGLILFNIIFRIGAERCHLQGMKMRLISISKVYMKILKLEQFSLNIINPSTIISLISNDVQRFDIGSTCWYFLFGSPTYIICGIVLLLIYSTPVALIGFTIVLLHLPIQILISKFYAKSRLKLSKTTDLRVAIMDQIIRGIRVLKMYNWEEAFRKRIDEIRAKEIMHAFLGGFMLGINAAFYETSIFIALFATYISGYALGKNISASELSLMYIILNLCRRYIVLYGGFGILFISESIATAQRIQTILDFPENTNTTLLHQPILLNGEKPFIRIEQFCASWNDTALARKTSLVVKNINLDLEQPNGFLAIMGPIGSGKSSLLLALINELPGKQGKIQIQGKISYAAQEPWIFSGSIRDNIVFGTTYDYVHFWAVVDACCLKEDINTFEALDLTLIGERGITLSGGQKSRVSLARALYRNSDIYLLDDPFSALDSKVGKEVFEKCIKCYLRDKLIILVTHHLHFAEQAERLLVLKNGEVLYNGNTNDSYKTMSLEVKELINKLAPEAQNICEAETLSCLEILNKDTNSYINTTLTKHNCVRNPHDITLVKYQNLQQSLQFDQQQNLNNEKDKMAVLRPDTAPLLQALSKEESENHGIRTYIQYFTSGGVLLTLLLIIVSILSNSTLLFSFWWLQLWTSTSSSSTHLSHIYANESLPSTSDYVNQWMARMSFGEFICYYVIFCSLGIIFSYCQAILLYYILLRASRQLHNKMLQRILNTPVRFFDTNPSGRILNRFAKDIGFLDETLPFFFSEFWQTTTHFLSVIVFACVTQYLLIIPSILAILLVILVRFYYLKTSKQIKHLEALSRSPLYTHVTHTLQGLTTIRSSCTEERFFQDYRFLQNEHSRYWYLLIILQIWLNSRLIFLSSTLIVLSLILGIIGRCILGRGELLEFTIPILVSLLQLTQYVVRQSSQVSIYIVSVERILDYCNLKQESIIFTSPKREPIKSEIEAITLTLESSLWPSRGNVEFHNVVFKYSPELPDSLTDLTFTISPGEKIGIVGRTGAGKSSILSALMRLSELSGGTILIDGKDISSIPLGLLRRNISIIPQEPFLFTGSLRYNMDPSSDFTDDDIWRCLEQVYLKETIQLKESESESEFVGLLTQVKENGHNFSAGEKQLLCLARALLRQNKIVVIDEATANVDTRTDRFLQKAIRKNLYDCTVLTIAHRLDTIMDSDRILVMENGRIRELESPQVLLNDKSSFLSFFVSQMPSSTQTYLRELASL